MAADSLKDATESAHGHSGWEMLIPWRGGVVRQFQVTGADAGKMGKVSVRNSPNSGPV